MKNIILTLSLLLSINAVHGQKLDRSKPPKAGPAPKIALTDPKIIKLDNGITILVVEDHKLPKISASFRIDAGPITEGSKAGTLNLMGSMLAEGTSTLPKSKFDSAIDQMGANVYLSASTSSVSALSKYFENAFLLMADALRNPELSQSSFEKIRSQTIASLRTNAKNPKTISTRAVNAITYGNGHPMGEFITEQSLSQITIDDVKKAYHDNLTPSRSYLTFIGDITPSVAKKLAVQAFGNWTGKKLELPILKLVEQPKSTEIDLIDLPNATQSEITITNLVSLSMKDPDYFATLLANDILGGGPTGKLFQALREKRGFTYGAYSTVGAGRFQSTFSATAAVRNEKVDSAVVEFLNQIKNMRTEPVTEDILQAAKNLYSGTFALGLENPARTASFASTILINELPNDFYRTYLQKINSVTTEDIKRVSQKYFGHDNTRIIIVGKQEAFLPGLERLGYPIKKFDLYANPIKGL